VAQYGEDLLMVLFTNQSQMICDDSHSVRMYRTLRYQVPKATS
jgi:hypothetical protein